MFRFEDKANLKSCTLPSFVYMYMYTSFADVFILFVSVCAFIFCLCSYVLTVYVFLNCRLGRLELRDQPGRG